MKIHQFDQTYKNSKQFGDTVQQRYFYITGEAALNSIILIYGIDQLDQLLQTLYTQPIISHN